MSAPLLDVVNRTVGIYGSAPTAYLSALARLDGFAIGDLDRAIEVDRTLVRVRAMRYSVYNLTHELLPVAVAATREGGFRSTAFRRQIGDAYPELAARVEAALADGPLPSTEIRTRVDPERELGDRFGTLLGMAAADCRIVRATKTGGWRSNRLTYARWSDWLPGIDPLSLDVDDARRRLAGWYVAAYGPVGLEDVAWWAGWKKSNARAAVEGLDLDIEGTAAELLDGVRLLPVWDALMVAYRHRDRLLDPEDARFVYDRFGNATSVVLDGGRVVGVWDLGRTDEPLSITVAPIGRWSKRRWSDVERQAARIAAMIGATDLRISRRDHPVDLVEAPRNRFLSPLAGST